MHSSCYGVYTFQMSLRNSDWLARSWCKMTPFTIHYHVATLPIPSSPITCSATLTNWFLFNPYHSIPDQSIAPTHPLPTFLLSNLLPDHLIILPLIFGNFPCTPQLIDPWYIRSHPGLMLFIVNWFESLSLYLLLPLTWSLVWCCCHWSYDVKSSSDFRKISLHLHSTIDRHLIDPQSPWFSAIDCQMIRIADPIYISPANPVPSLLLSSPVFCYQTFLWFYKNSLQLHSLIDRPLIDPQLPWSSSINFQLIQIVDPIYISPTDPVPGLSLSSLVFCFRIFIWFSKIFLALALYNW